MNHLGQNARFEDVNRRIDGLQSDIRELRGDLHSDIRELRSLVIDAIKSGEPAN